MNAMFEKVRFLINLGFNWQLLFLYIFLENWVGNDSIHKISCSK